MDSTLLAPAAIVLCAAVLGTGGVLLRRGHPQTGEDYAYKNLYSFTPKHGQETKNNILSGITLLPWLEILWRRKYDVDFLTYWRRILFITVLASFNSIFALVETVVYGRAINRQQLNNRPVFILGHPRTGTTHLFNLLSLDKKFVYPTTFQAGFPSACLLLNRWTRALNGVIDDTRPMDNMALSLESPQEDELACNVLTAGTSYYFSLVFMAKEKEFRPYVTFKDATVQERNRWQEAFSYFCRKVTLQGTETRDGKSDPKRMLLKSPVHTGRIELMLQLFPEAQFIYIHRHPYDVFLSAARMADTAYWYSNLSVPTDNEIIEFILWQYDHLYTEYINGRRFLRPDQLFELSFDELNEEPMAKIEEIYKHFGWTGFDGDGHADAGVRSELKTYLDSLKDYQKSTSRRGLTDEQKRLIYQRWKKSFEMYHYDK